MDHKRPSHFNSSKKQVNANTLKRFEVACDLLVGEGIFRLFDSVDISCLIKVRFSAVKMTIAPSKTIDEYYSKQYRAAFLMLLSKNTLKTPVGSHIHLDLYLREGLTLVWYVKLHCRNGNAKFADLKKAFSPWIEKKEFYNNSVLEILQHFHRFSLCISNWSSELLIMNTDHLALVDVATKDNCLQCSTEKLPSQHIVISGIRRKISAIGWPDFQGVTQMVFLGNQNLGPNSFSQVNAQVYIQSHALDRLQERLGIVPGIMHKAIFDTFVETTPQLVWNLNSAQIPLSVLGHKVGYLVCNLSSDKFIIQTFLFLTNDGTPEGKRFNKLTKLAKMDKEFLKLDTLDGILGLDISENLLLKKIFIDSGCDALLNLGSLKRFCRYKITQRCNEELLRYLAG